MVFKLEIGLKLQLVPHKPYALTAMTPYLT